MARAHFADVLIETSGTGALSLLDGATVHVYDQGTTTPISQTLYAADSGGTTIANPLTSDANGKVEFWLDTPARVDLAASKTGFTSSTRTVDVETAPSGGGSGLQALANGVQVEVYDGVLSDGVEYTPVFDDDDSHLAVPEPYLVGFVKAEDQSGYVVPLTGRYRLSLHARIGRHATVWLYVQHRTTPVGNNAYESVAPQSVTGGAPRADVTLLNEFTGPLNAGDIVSFALTVFDGDSVIEDIYLTAQYLGPHSLA